MPTKSKDAKKEEIRIYDSIEEEGRSWGSHWDKNHQEELAEFGPRKTINELICENSGGERALDIGCGRAGHTFRLEKFGKFSKIIGLDISLAELTKGRENFNNGEYVLGDGEMLPFQDGSFDLVLSVAALHHLPNFYDEALPEIARILKPSGVLVFAEGAKFNPFAMVYRQFLSSEKHTESEEPFDPRKLEAELLTIFETVEMEGHYLFSPLFPVMDNLAPFDLPRSFSKRCYEFEKPFLDRWGKRLSAHVTGVATKPGK